MPDGHFDYAVLLGVFTYLSRPETAARKVCAAADHLVVSYCCRRAGLAPRAVRESRRRRGWVNDFSQTEFVRMISRHGHELTSSKLYKATGEFEEFVMVFSARGLAARAGRIAGTAPR